MFEKITSTYAIEQISRDGVFIEYTSMGKPVVDRVRTVEKFDKYCKVIKRDLARLNKQDKALADISKHLYESSLRIGEKLTDEYDCYLDGFRDAILTFIGLLKKEELFVEPSKEQSDK